MGQNLILNMNDHGFVVCAYNRSPEKVTAFLENEAKGTKVRDKLSTHWQPNWIEFFLPWRNNWFLLAGRGSQNIRGFCCSTQTTKENHVNDQSWISSRWLHSKTDSSAKQRRHHHRRRQLRAPRHNKKVCEEPFFLKRPLRQKIFFLVVWWSLFKTSYCTLISLLDEQFWS